jgi:hypothetical protein
MSVRINWIELQVIADRSEAEAEGHEVCFYCFNRRSRFWANERGIVCWLMAGCQILRHGRYS